MNSKRKQSPKKVKLLHQLRRRKLSFALVVLASFFATVLVSCKNEPEWPNQHILKDVERAMNFSKVYIRYETDSSLKSIVVGNNDYKNLISGSPYSIEILQSSFPDSSKLDVIVEKSEIKDGYEQIISKKKPISIMQEEVQLSGSYFFAYEVYDVSKTDLKKTFYLRVHLSKMKKILDSPLPGMYGETVFVFRRFY